MSRTDKTKPLWVRHAEHSPRPVHDHRYGPCDLPPHPTREAAATRCRWEHPGALLFGHTCCAGCQRRGCTKEWQGYVRSGNRRTRHMARREARRYVMGERVD
ncbi:hypothetical protein ADK86_17230 [Streptomyces sp. NRRL F-5755]|uniref:hypothetical protein n=1 Tax=Streptomyces sp. NRRL F-5755 TaxID=1519475 RepID=UPI0006ADAD96|nr:hypothetical protein [Streptomyces sp. NRRL F-5755]KOT95762.1 hypothetical protein ADK86_17230 [Streptomyces sp. NRRL F-5755]